MFRLTSWSLSEANKNSLPYKVLIYIKSSLAFWFFLLMSGGVGVLPGPALYNDNTVCRNTSIPYSACCCANTVHPVECLNRPFLLKRQILSGYSGVLGDLKEPVSLQGLINYKFILQYQKLSSLEVLVWQPDSWASY